MAHEMIYIFLPMFIMYNLSMQSHLFPCQHAYISACPMMHLRCNMILLTSPNA